MFLVVKFVRSDRCIAAFGTHGPARQVRMEVARQTLDDYDYISALDWQEIEATTTGQQACPSYFRGAASRSSRRRSRLSVSLQTLPNVAARTPRPVAPPMRRVIRIWYLTASCGSTPDRIWPVIIPGRETTPVAAMELMIGVKPLRTARWCAAATASHRVLPSSSLASIAVRSL